MNSTTEIMRKENKILEESKSPDIAEAKEKIPSKYKTLQKEKIKDKKKSEKKSGKQRKTDINKCNKCDEVFEKETCLNSHMLKKHKEENVLKCDNCDLSCAGLVTPRKHTNTNHPHAESQSKTGPTNEARKQSLMKSDKKCEDDYKPKVTETLQCETPVVCELIGCCWCKYQI